MAYLLSQKKITAQVWLEKERLLLESGNWKAPETRKDKKQKNIYFVDFAKEFLDNLEIRQNTRYRNEKNFEKHIFPFFKNYKISDISTSVVRKWYDGLPKDKPSVRNNSFSIVKRIMASASEPDDNGNSLIEKNPCLFKIKPYHSKKNLTVFFKRTIR
ncbi:MAG: hypothetical protein LBT85_00555 [Bifidobacteriaceae bacterium]|jgi:hypothetical protein|nr:hypothetical protein [Bifidobacteriaceae bacterium]